MTLKKFVWMIPFLVLCSCASINNQHKEEENWEADQEAVAEMMQDIPVEVLEYDGDLSPLTIVDEVENESTESLVNFQEGDPNQYVTVIDSSVIEPDAPYALHGEYTPTLKDVTLVDENEEEIAITLMNAENGHADYLIPVNDFSSKHGYHLKLTNDKVRFLNKDASIRQITYYSLNVTNENRRRLVNKNNTIKTLDLSKVDYFDTDAYGAYFIYNDVFDIEQSVLDETGMKFRLQDPAIEEDNEDTVYGKLISTGKNPNGAGYLVRYEPCKGEDLYTALDINDSVDVDESNMENLTFLQPNEDLAEGLAQAFLAHDDVVTTVHGLMKHFGVKRENLGKSKYEWASHLQIKFNTQWDSSSKTFTWGVIASLNFTPTSNISVTLHLDYKQTIKYKMSASVSIETWLFIPTGISYTLKVEEDDTKEVTFGVIIATNFAPYDDEKVQEAIKNDLSEAMAKNTDIKSKFAGDGPCATPTGKTYPLFRFDFYYFFPLDVRFEIDFYWSIQLSFEALVKFTSHTQRVDVSVSNKKGCDPHSESKAINDKNVTLQFMGNFHAEIGISATLGIGISGLYKFFHAQVFIAAYGALDAQGFMIIGVMWGSGKDTTVTGMWGGKFEISVGVKWGVDIYLLFGGYTHTWPIAKAVLVGFSHDSAINNFVKEESVLEITDQDYGHVIDLDDYHMLGVAAFDAKNFSSSYIDMKHDDGATVQYGSWMTEKKERYFNFELTKGSQYVTFNDYKLEINDIWGIEEFDAEIKVTVNEDYDCALAGTLSKTIKIHFTNNLKQQINVVVDGQEISIGSYIIGAQVHLPVPTAPRYMRFVGWKNTVTGQTIAYDETDPNTGLYVPQDTEEVNFEYIFVDDYTWTVVWLDGFGNIIKTEEVFYDTAANEPLPRERDQYMISFDPNYEYVFTGWDTEFGCITANTVIRATYELRRR